MPYYNDCPVGEYRNGLTVGCLPCGVGMSTYDNNAFSRSPCLCIPGYFNYRDAISLSPASYIAMGITTSNVPKCMPCSYGSYQPTSNQPSCIACPLSSNTTYIASTSIDDCICEDGYRMVNAVCVGKQQLIGIGAPFLSIHTFDYYLFKLV
jgi:hypothetical protein